MIVYDYQNLKNIITNFRLGPNPLTAIFSFGRNRFTETIFMPLNTSRQYYGTF